MKIGVIIVTRNRAASLRGTLAALSAQSRPADEVIVVDNGSSDETRGVVAEFSGRLPVRYLREDVPSIPLARNAGARASSADIIAFTDDDCVPDQGWVANLEKPFLRDPEIGLVGGAVFPYYCRGGIIDAYCASDTFSGWKAAVTHNPEAG